MCYVSSSNCVSNLSQLSFLASFSFYLFIYLLLRVDKNIDAQKNWDSGILQLQEITAWEQEVLSCWEQIGQLAKCKANKNPVATVSQGQKLH